MKRFGPAPRTKAQKYASLQQRIVLTRSLDGFDPEKEAARSGLSADVLRSMLLAEQERRAKW